jgi:aspartate carbamoyltransferase catalytic subunit
MSNSLAGRDLLSIEDLSKAEIEMILAQAARLEEQCQEQPKLNLLSGRILATMFYEPSTRTRLSFESAMHRLGGDVISTASAAKTSSAAKGEMLSDAARMLSGYAHLIAQRHPQVGSAKETAAGATVPVINAGDGSNEHPTQALLDLYTIQKERGQIDGLCVAMVGDLKYGRTVHSLSRALVHWDVTLTLVSPQSLRMPAPITQQLKQTLTVNETGDLAAVMGTCDVLYVTRIQKERFKDPADYDKVKNSYVITRKLVNSTNPEITIMHPLPRVNEIATDVDGLQGAAYFRQADNGVWARMALMALILDSWLDG